MNIEQMKVIVCLKMMYVEQYEQLNVGKKRVIEIYDKSDNILIKQATKRGYIECENGGGS